MKISGNTAMFGMVACGALLVVAGKTLAVSGQQEETVPDQTVSRESALRVDALIQYAETDFDSSDYLLNCADKVGCNKMGDIEFDYFLTIRPEFYSIISGAIKAHKDGQCEYVTAAGHHSYDPETGQYVARTALRAEAVANILAFNGVAKGNIMIGELEGKSVSMYDVPISVFCTRAKMSLGVG